MRGSTFKRCTVCDHVVKRKKCANCGSTSWSWGHIIDVGKDGDGKRRQQRRTVCTPTCSRTAVSTGQADCR